MTRAANPPAGYHTITAAIAMKNAANAVRFYKEVFGAREVLRFDMPDGAVAHAEIQIGDTRMMLADENPQYNRSPATLGGSTVVLMVYVDDADAVIARAVAAGARLLIPPADHFYGDRSGRIEDPFGHVWTISTHKEDVSEEEMQRRFAAMLKQGGAE